MKVVAKMYVLSSRLKKLTSALLITHYETQEKTIKLHGIFFYGSTSSNKQDPVSNLQEDTLRKICFKKITDKDNFLFATDNVIFVHETDFEEFGERVSRLTELYSNSQPNCFFVKKGSNLYFPPG